MLSRKINISVTEREREAVCEPSKTKKLKVRTGASSRSQKTSRWLILSAEEAAEHLQHAHDGASLLWKWSGSGLINRMTFKEWLTELRGGEMWGHVKAWKAKKKYCYIMDISEQRDNVCELKSISVSLKKLTWLTALRWRWSVRFYRTDWDYLRHTLQHKCPQKDRSTTSVQMHYMYISENICSSH